MTQALGGAGQTTERADPGTRWNAVLVVVGACWVVLGGLVAAVTGPMNLEHGSWTAAYLVLVCGMAQCAFGEARAHLGLTRPAGLQRWMELLGWNLGNIAVFTGILASIPVLSDVGGVLLLVALVTQFRSVHRTRRVLLAGAYRVVLAILIISIPIGLVLGHLGAR